jgi:fused signal recognition particle receptor
MVLLGSMVVGTLARLADAGLGCPDWPGCYGKIIVDEQTEAMRAAVGGKSPWQPELERVHRYLSGVLEALVLLAAVTVWWVRHNRTRAIVLTYALLLLVGAQALLEFWVGRDVTTPLRTALHLSLEFLALALTYWLYLTVTPGVDEAAARATPALRWLARFGLLLLLVEITLGAWTSSHFAGLACPHFPTCLGAYWPDLDWRRAFTLWPDPAAGYPGGVLPAETRAAIHLAHRIGALLVLVTLYPLALGVSSNRAAARLSKPGVLLSLLLLLQVGAGIALVLLRLPIVVALAHHLLAALLLLNVVHLNVYLRRRLPEEVRVAPVAEVAVPTPVPEETLFERLKGRIGKTRTGLTGFLASLPLRQKGIDRALLEDIETQLLLADVGVNATQAIVGDLTASLERHELSDWEALRQKLREQLAAILRPCGKPLVIPPEVRPFVILVVGVNGVGKTTTIGKLAKRLKNQRYSVMLAAGDTFRAAAVEQLQTWGERNRIPVIAQHGGADSASVIFDAVQAAQSRGIDVLIADTAGRLHTKSNLMEELRKIKRILGRLDATAPHEVLLVLDAGTGQNAISQTRQFHEAIGVTGIALTKLDGTAKGGVIFALARQFGIPIRYIGIGEGIDDLQDFDADHFIDALFANE